MIVGLPLGTSRSPTDGLRSTAVGAQLARITPIAGIGFLLLTLLSELLKGDSPSTVDPPLRVATYLEEHRNGILGGAYVQMLGLALFLIVVLVAIERIWLVGGRRVEAALAATGALLTIVAYTAYVFFTSALAFGAGPDLDLGTLESLWEVRFMAETFIAFPAALLLGAVGVAGLRMPGLQTWYAPATIFAAFAFLVGAAAVARTGFFAPDGDYGFVLFWLLPLWTAVTGFVVRGQA
jgi:hypothetical protein